MMSPQRIDLLETTFRLMAGGVGVFFLFIGIGFFTLPEVLATAFLVEPARAVGINSIRGDFSALFLGMGFFCLLGTLTTRRYLLMVPVVFLAIVMTGRVTGLFVDDVPVVVAGSIAAELLFIIVLALSVITSSAKPSGAGVNLRQYLTCKLLAGILVLILLIGGIFMSKKEIGMKLVDVIATQFARTDVLGELPDGLHAGLAGAGAPFPDAKRAGPCTFVIAGRKIFVVDAGPGSVRRMELMKLPLGDVTAVLLTHYHSDHICDVGELMLKRWASGSRPDQLPVFGPPGVETVVQGFNLAYSLDSGYRVAHHGQATTPPSGAGGVARPFDFPPGKETVVIMDDGGVKVTAFLVDHRPVVPAVGYRFDYKGRSVVISGDTLPSETLRRQARGVDVLLHEAMQPSMIRELGRINKAAGRSNVASINADILNYHSFPEEAARIAASAGVGHLVFHHILPPLPVSEANVLFSGDSKRFYSGPITVGVDGMLFSMPAGRSEILKKWMLK